MAAAAVSGGGGGLMTWQEELATLVGDAGIRYPGTGDGVPAPAPVPGVEGRNGFYGFGEAHPLAAAAEDAEEESLKEQLKGFVASTGEMMRELGKGLWDITRQSLEGAEDSDVVKRLRGPASAAARRLSFLNEYLPEDRDPVHAWPVVIGVFLLALVAVDAEEDWLQLGFRLGGFSVFFASLNVCNRSEAPIQVDVPKKLYISPPSARRIQLPDGRNLAYEEQGVLPDRARFSVIAPHSILSSRVAGIPGIRATLLEEFGVRLVTYDLPGFGESDPHPGRTLNSSAFDMLHLANSLEIVDKFWVVGYSGGGMHAWAAVRYIPDRLAGAAMFAPMANPYDSSMTKEERRKNWDKWTTKRKFLYVLARRFPSILGYFYRRSFLSGRQGQPEKWLSVSLGKKDKSLLEDPVFKEFWEKDVGESVRQGDAKPFMEEAVLLVSDWGFSLSDLQVQKQKEGKGLLLWLKSIYSRAEQEWAGFLGPIHIWQGTDDRVVPASMTEFVRRVVPGATVHRLLGEGHFSYFCFCDECHRQIFSTLFGIPQGPLSTVALVAETVSEFPPDPIPNNNKEPDNTTEQVET